MQIDLSGLSFTSCARQVFALAKDEADRLKHEYFGSEHILLGLLGMADGGASRALDIVGVDRGLVRSQVEAMCPIGSGSGEGQELPYDAAGITLLQNSMAEARRSGVREVSTGHILLGALMNPEDPPCQALSAAGVSVSQLVAATQANVSDDEPGP
jgi:ATP-dependent Clp protease ATP-binding subunit ClpA